MIRAGAMSAQAGNPRGKVPSRFLQEWRNVGWKALPPSPLPVGGRGGTQDVLMRLEPSSHSKTPSSSPPCLSCCLPHAGTLWDIPPSPDQGGHRRAPPAAAPSPRGQHPREQSTGQIQAQGIRPGRERGNRRVRLCPAPAEKVPFQSYHNPGSSCPQPQRLSGDLPPPPGTCSGVLGHR